MPRLGIWALLSSAAPAAPAPQGPVPLPMPEGARVPARSPVAFGGLAHSFLQFLQTLLCFGALIIQRQGVAIESACFFDSSLLYDCPGQLRHDQRIARAELQGRSQEAFGFGEFIHS